MRRGFVVPLSFLLLAASACSSTPDRSAPIDSGVNGGAGGGAGAAGGAGGGAGGAGGAVAVNCGAGGGPIDPTALIDDMEGNDPELPRIGGRTGSWWAGGDPASPNATIKPNGDAPAAVIPGGRCGSQHAMRVSGQGFTQWAQVTASMRYGAQDGGTQGLLPYDASFRTGVTFWARIGDTSASYVRYSVSDQYSRPEGGHCDPTATSGPTTCYDEFGVDLPGLSTAWTQYQIPFAGLAQRDFGLQRPKLDTTAIYSINFNFAVGEIFDLWIDDISFY